MAPIGRSSSDRTTTVVGERKKEREGASRRARRSRGESVCVKSIRRLFRYSVVLRALGHCERTESRYSVRVSK